MASNKIITLSLIESISKPLIVAGLGDALAFSENFDASVTQSGADVGPGPNEPAGFTTVASGAFQCDGVEREIWDYTSGATPVSVADAPSSDPCVLQRLYPLPHTEGAGNAAWGDVLSHGFKRLYMRTRWRLDPNYQGHDSGSNKTGIFVIRHNSFGGNDRSWLWWYSHGTDLNTLTYRMLPQFVAAPSADAEGWITTPHVINRNQWHELEILIGLSSVHDAPDGMIRAWVDGTLRVDRTDYHMPGANQSNIEATVLSGMWGGVGDTMTNEDQWIQFDRTYVSGSTSRT